MIRTRSQHHDQSMRGSHWYRFCTTCMHVLCVRICVRIIDACHAIAPSPLLPCPASPCLPDMRPVPRSRCVMWVNMGSLSCVRPAILRILGRTLHIGTGAIRPASRQLICILNTLKPAWLSHSWGRFNTMDIIRICPPPPLPAVNSFRTGRPRRTMIRKGLRNHKVRGGMPWMESRESFYLIPPTICSQRFPENSWFRFFSFFQNTVTGQSQDVA